MSQRNTAGLNIINRQLANLREKLFGEAEVPKDCDSGNDPMPSVAQSLGMSRDETTEAIRQLETILSRL